MAGRGYVKLHREIESHPTFAHDGLFRLWSYCMLRANWKDTQWLIPGTTTSMVVRRGQFITGRESLHSRLYGPEYRGEHRPASRTLWRWLESLCHMKCITMDTVSNRCTLVTVCNYEAYQGDDDSECPGENGTEPPRTIIVTSEKSVQTLEMNLSDKSTNDFVSKSNQSASLDLYLLCDNQAGNECPAAVPQVSRTCPADVPPVSTTKETKKGRKKEQEPISVPELLKTPEFDAAWHAWEKHRKEIKKPLTPTTAVAQIKMLAKLGPQRAVAAIEHTIFKGWTGLREPDASDSSSPPPLARPLTESEFETWNPIDGGGA